MCCDGISGPDCGQLSDSSRRDCSAGPRTTAATTAPFQAEPSKFEGAVSGDLVKCPDDRKEVKVGSKPALRRWDGRHRRNATLLLSKGVFGAGSGRGGGEWWEGGGVRERRRGRGG